MRCAYNHGMFGFVRRLKERIKAWSERRGEAQDWLRTFYYHLNQRLGGALGIVRHAFNNFTLMRGGEAAASLAYYGLFSIFPLILAVVSIGSMVLEREMVKQQLLEALTDIIPTSTEAVNAQISRVLDLRGPITIVAVFTLLWSGSNVFEKLIINVNRAFPRGHRPGFLKRRGMALLIIIVMILLFVVSLILSTVVEIFPSFEDAIFGALIAKTKAWVELLQIIPLILKFLLFLAVFSWIPQSAQIRFKARLIGALVTAALWELSSRLLGWAISSGFANYEIVYGSLASIIALLFWLYLSGYILFFGAHLTHAINTHYAKKEEDALKLLPDGERTAP